MVKHAIAALLLSACVACVAQEHPDVTFQKIQLPSSKVLFTPAPGSPRRTNSLPTTAAVSPDQRYVALLNAGFGTAESHLGQSITLLDRTNNQLTEFADERLRPRFKQTYFFGLAFSPSGDELYASVASLLIPKENPRATPAAASPSTPSATAGFRRAAFLRFLRRRFPKARNFRPSRRLPRI